MYPPSTLILRVVYLQIQLPTSGHNTSSSDSSDFSSEDDSTVHVKTRARSPSPHKGKHRRHRSHSRSCSRSGSPAQAKMKELTVTDGSPSSKSTGRAAEGSSSQASTPGEKDKNMEDPDVWCTTKSSCCHRSHTQLLCLFFYTFTILYVFCNEKVQFMMPSGLSRWLTLPWVVLLRCAHCKFLFIKLSFFLYFFYLWLCPFSGVDSTGSWHLALRNSQGFMVV